MSHEEFREVRFDIYCKECKYEKLEEVKDPCNECLCTGMNLNSIKPIFFHEKE